MPGYLLTLASISMMPTTQTFTPVSAGVLLFFALVFALPSGYSYGAVLLLLTFFWALCKDRRIDPTWRSLSRSDKTLIAILISYFVISAITIIYLGNSIKSLEIGRAHV